MHHEFSHKTKTPYQKLYSSIILAALDDAIADEHRYGNGIDGIGRWANSRDGQMILRCAGVEPSDRCVKGLQSFVSRGVKTSTALSREPRTPGPQEMLLAG